MADPRKYREEAERLRKEADEASHPETRGMMLDIAELYERLARAIAKRRRDVPSNGPTTRHVALAVAKPRRSEA